MKIESNILFFYVHEKSFCLLSKDLLALQGFLLHKTAYLRNGWNVLDFFILFLSWLEMSNIFSGSQGKVFRLARALRPLRIIKRNKGLRMLSEVILIFVYFETFNETFGPHEHYPSVFEQVS